jgi:hypothetical protein
MVCFAATVECAALEKRYFKLTHYREPARETKDDHKGQIHRGSSMLSQKGGEGAEVIDVKKLGDLAKIPRLMIERQLELASKSPDEALADPWALGYCFGMFDAMAQRAELDPHNEGFVLISVGFIALMADNVEGAERVRRAVVGKADPRFIEGNRTASDEFFAWLAARDKAPMSLFDHVTSTSPAPR